MAIRRRRDQVPQPTRQADEHPVSLRDLLAGHELREELVDDRIFGSPQDGYLTASPAKFGFLQRKARKKMQSSEPICRRRNSEY
jgi:hypothetical protein